MKSKIIPFPLSKQDDHRRSMAKQEQHVPAPNGALLDTYGHITDSMDNVCRGSAA